MSHEFEMGVETFLNEMEKEKMTKEVNDFVEDVRKVDEVSEEPVQRFLGMDSEQFGLVNILSSVGFSIQDHIQSESLKEEFEKRCEQTQIDPLSALNYIRSARTNIISLMNDTVFSLSLLEDIEDQIIKKGFKVDEPED